MALEDDIDFLDRIPTMHILGREALRILAISAEEFRVNGGDVLFEEGEPADGGYVVLTGSFMLKRARGHMEEESLIAAPGALMGETALVVETVRPATATAIEPSSVLRVSRSMFLRMLEGEPEAAAALRRLISGRVDAALEELDIALPQFEDEDWREPNLR